MEDKSLNIMIGGEAGQGLVTVGQMLSRSLIRSGYEILVSQDYMSRIRGGHNTFTVRVDTEEVLGPREGVDVLVALNQETIDLHRPEMTGKSLVIGDESLDFGEGNSLQVPFKELAPRPIFTNIAALGVIGCVLGLDRGKVSSLIESAFRKKGEKIVEDNKQVLADAWDWAAERDPGFASLPGVPDRGKRLMLDGNQAIALGAMAAGVRFCSFYPMTPSTSIPLTLARHMHEMGIMVEQAEDEIAVVNMALGASFAGAPAIISTSGGGLALMCEGISLAGITETPIVAVCAQRPGPATGLPTRSEQGDLNLVLYAGHGEFPRAIYAPGTVEDFFFTAHKAFDLAERWQSPVFILTDQYMADSPRGVDPFDLTGLEAPARPGKETEKPAEYVRYEVTESGVSPRLMPGFGEYLVVVDSDEHYPDGHITEEAGVRNEMVEKRLRKGCGLFEEARPPDVFGEGPFDTLLVCWGSTRGPAVEAARRMSEEGSKTGVMHFSQVWPLNPKTFLEHFEQAKRVVCVEMNATGQFAALIRQETGFSMDALVLKYDGRPFTAAYIQERVKSPEASGVC